MKNILKSGLMMLFLGITAISCTSDEKNPPYKAIFFSEDFEGITNTGAGQYVALEGWSNVSLNGGKKWEARIFNDDKFAQLSSYNTGEANMDTWLITPALNFDQTTNETLVFNYLAGYYTGPAVSVLVSTDYDGSNTAAAISAATWTDLHVTLPDYLTTGYPANFSSSGLIDLSSYNGTVYVAFRYVGSATGVTTTYEIDDIKLFENK